MLYIGRLHPRPLGACQQCPTCRSRLQARCVEGATRYEKLRALACSKVRSHRGHATRAVRKKHQHLKWVAQVVVVELVGAYPVHDNLGFRADEEVKGRGVGALTFVGVGQGSGWDLQGAAVGFGYETAGGMRLEPEHRLDLLRRRACL